MAKIESFGDALDALVIGITLLFALTVLMGYPTMLLINYLFSNQLLTFVFGATKITFGQGVALNFLISGLLKIGSSKG